MNSSHRADVVSVQFSTHPNAEKLSLAKFDGGQTVVNTQDWLNAGGGTFPTTAIWVQPDSLVDTNRPEFSFLNKNPNQTNTDGVPKYHRVKTIKLRDEWSWGMLVPCDQNLVVGTDMAESLGVLHYEPVEENATGETSKAPSGVLLPSKYDLENLKKYHSYIPQGTLCNVFEKVDGENWLAVYLDGEYHVKSRSNWKREFQDRSNLNLDFFLAKGKTPEEAAQLVANVNAKPAKQCHFWQGLRANESLMKFLMDNPGTFVFGELFKKARVNYKIQGSRVDIFDMFKDGKFFDSAKTLDLARKSGLRHVPVLKENFAFNDAQEVIEMAEGKTQVEGADPNEIREGIVVKPVTELYSPKLGRVALKCHSPSFLLR